MSSSLRTVTSLLHTGISPNSINKDFVPCSWKESIIFIKTLQQQAASLDVINTKSFVPLFIRAGDLHLHAWFGIVKNFAVYVLLCKSTIPWCNGWIIPAERKIVPWHWKPMANITTNITSGSRNGTVTVFTMNWNSHEDVLSNKFNLCRVAPQIVAPASTGPTVLASCQGSHPITIESRLNVVERWCPMTARGLMNSLPGKQFYVYISNFTDKPANHPKDIRFRVKRPQHASYTQEVMSQPYGKIRDQFQHSAIK